MTRDEFNAIWAEREPGLREYVAALAQRDDVVDDVLGYARADLEADLAGEPNLYGAAFRYVAPFIPRVNEETHAIICAMAETGHAAPEGTLADKAAHLATWHAQELASPRPYHPVVRHVDLAKVDWVGVALGG